MGAQSALKAIHYAGRRNKDVTTCPRVESPSWRTADWCPAVSLLRRRHTRITLSRL